MGSFQSNLQRRRAAIKNTEVAQLLRSIADILELKGDSIYRIAAYREAARNIENLQEDIAVVAREDRLRDIPGVGPSIAGKVQEYLTTGKLDYYEDLRKGVSMEAVELLQVPGLGPRRAQYIYQKLHVTSLDELERAAAEHRLSQLPGIGRKTEDKLLKELHRLRQRTRRLLLSVALTAAEEVVDILRQNPAVLDIEPAGSIRRRKETIGDIDILVSSRDPSSVMDTFTTMALVKEVIARGPTRSSILTNDDLQIDIRVVDPSTYGAALQYFTGSKEHNIALRTLALNKGLTISEYGIFEVDTGKRRGGEREQDIYEVLGMQWPPPELREDRGEIEAALRGELPHLIEDNDVKGDLHIHTDWSDGTAPIIDMVETAVELGYQYIAICDHSKALGIAHGLSVDRVREQQKLIEMLNCKFAPFVILSGTEVDILKDGTIDYPNEVLKSFDLVTASVHSAFGQSREAMTARIIKALRNPYVDVLNHPTGRILLQREPYDVDLERVLQVAAETGTALEINSSPNRLDLDDIWSRRAKELGVNLVINTDAHAPAQLAFMRYGVAVARRGWLEPRNVLNTRIREKLSRKLHRKSA
ncbi:MAG: DNA polymerase/3'-5' exonuclease PolX [Chloroflexota bacterium]